MGDTSPSGGGPGGGRRTRGRPRGGGGRARPRAETGPGWALARTAEGLTSAVVALYGWDAEEAAVSRDVQANAYGPHSATPYLRPGAHPGGHSVQVSLIALSRDTVHPQALREAVTVEVAAGSVRLAFPDGSVEDVRHTTHDV